MIKVGGTYWAIVPINPEDFGWDPLEPYQVVVYGNQRYNTDLWNCHVADRGEKYPPYVGCRTEDLFETYAAAAAEYRKELAAMADHLEQRIKWLREESASFPDDPATRAEQVRKEQAEAEARYLEIERNLS